MSHQRTVRVARTKRAIIQLLLEYLELVVGWCSVRSVLGKSTGTKNQRLINYQYWYVRCGKKMCRGVIVW